MTEPPFSIDSPTRTSVTVAEKTAVAALTCCRGVSIAHEQPEAAVTGPAVTRNRTVAMENAASTRIIMP